MLKNWFSDALKSWGIEGLERFCTERPDHGFAPVLSHVCFKFASEGDYKEWVAAAGALGEVSRRQHNGKEITWCRLHHPVQHRELTLEWLELVAPTAERLPASGVSAIGYAVPGLSEVVKIQSRDKAVTFRYQSRHAAELAA